MQLDGRPICARRQFIRQLLAAGLGLTLPMPAALAQSSANSEVPLARRPYPLPRTQVIRIPAPALGRSYDYAITLPPGYRTNAARRYPVLMYTDMPQSIALLVGMQQRLRADEAGLEDAILVGLGYAVGDTRQYSRRRDYTPSIHGDIDAVSDMPGRPVRYGEAEDYRQHLANDVLPVIERHFRIDPARRIYLGHSYGGLFGTHVLLTTPRMFAKYILISPSLWFGQRLMIARERGYASSHNDLPAEVCFLIGSLETVPDPDIVAHSHSRMKMVEDMAELVRNLRARNYPSLHVAERILVGEDHLSVYVPAVHAGLLWALPGHDR